VELRFLLPYKDFPREVTLQEAQKKAENFAMNNWKKLMSANKATVQVKFSEDKPYFQVEWSFFEQHIFTGSLQIQVQRADGKIGALIFDKRYLLPRRIKPAPSSAEFKRYADDSLRREFSGIVETKVTNTVRNVIAGPAFKGQKSNESTSRYFWDYWFIVKTQNLHKYEFGVRIFEDTKQVVVLEKAISRDSERAKSTKSKMIKEFWPVWTKSGDGVAFISNRPWRGYPSWERGYLPLTT
jgi:hypothetical protein